MNSSVYFTYCTYLLKCAPLFLWSTQKNYTVFDGEPSISMPPPEKVSLTLTFESMTLKP